LKLGVVKIVVLDAATLDFPDPAWDGLRAHGDVTLHPLTASDRAVIAERCAGAEVVLTNKVPLDAATLGALPALRLVSVLATGHNMVDGVAARARGVVVCNAPGYSTMAVVQHTLALILEWTNQVALHDAAVRSGEWVRSPMFSFWKTSLWELSGDTVGIIGFGSIGARVAEVLHGMGANVLANSRGRKGAPAWGPFAWASVEEIFEKADVVSLHCPQTPENARFVNAALLARMKPTALLVNTARGGLIDEAALAAALKAGRPAAAALDVVTHEPMRADCPLLGLLNCLITPHIAWASEKARRRLLEITAANLRAFAAGAPQNVVN
jgi:glycerate dehydrogenase